MNIKTTIHLLDVSLKRYFVNFSFHFEGVLLAVRGCTWHAQGVLGHPQNPKFSAPAWFATRDGAGPVLFSAVALTR